MRRQESGTIFSSCARARARKAAIPTLRGKSALERERY